MPRSVATRAEIGRNPCRNRSISGSRSVVPVRGAMSRGWGSYESGLTVAGQPCRCSHAPGAVVTAITQHEEPCPDAHARPGAVEVAHSCTPHISRNRGIMRNSNVSNGHGPAPMCADPPHRTWEPDRRTRRSPDKPVIPTKTSPHSAETPVSHVQHQQQPHPPSTPGPTQPNSNRR